MKALPKKLLPLILFGIAVTSLFSVQPAQAYMVTLEQVGANVVATGSGAFSNASRARPKPSWLDSTPLFALLTKFLASSSHPGA